MEVPNEVSTASQEDHSVNSVVGVGISAHIPLLGSGTGNARLESRRGQGEEQRQVRGRRGLPDVVREIGDSDFVILLDDFHYIAKDVQIEVMRQIKEAVRLRVKICVASVLHRADEAIRANQEMQGRFTVVDLDYWEQEELTQIAEAGFDALQLSLPNHVKNTFSIEAAGSPQLMQTLCLQACRNFDHRQSLGIAVEKNPTVGETETVLEDASNTMDFRSIVDILDCGPKERGRERKVYTFKDGSNGDVYRCILKCIAQDPPRLSFSYDELLSRANLLCDGDSPGGSSMQGSCEHMIRLAQDKFPTERQIDWNREREVLDIAEPYLLFYLRWSGRLSEPNT